MPEWRRSCAARTPSSHSPFSSKYEEQHRARRPSIVAEARGVGVQLSKGTGCEGGGNLATKTGNRRGIGRSTERIHDANGCNVVTSICECLRVSTSVCEQLRVFASNYECQRAITSVNERLRVSTSDYECQRATTSVNERLRVSTSGYECQRAVTSVNERLRVFTRFR